MQQHCGVLECYAAREDDFDQGDVNSGLDGFHGYYPIAKPWKDNCDSQEGNDWGNILPCCCYSHDVFYLYLSAKVMHDSQDYDEWYDFYHSAHHCF